MNSERRAAPAGASIASHSPAGPSSSDFASTAASGSSTMTLSHSVATPSPMGPTPPATVPAGAAVRAGRWSRVRRPTSARSAGGLVVDLRDGAVLGLEQLVVDLAPAAEVVDRVELLRRREVDGELLRDGPVDGAEAGLGPRLLALGRVEEVDERLRLLLVLAGVEDRDRVLDLERRARRVVLDRPRRCARRTAPRSRS